MMHISDRQIIGAMLDAGASECADDARATLVSAGVIDDDE